MLDHAFGPDLTSFHARTRQFAESLAGDPSLASWLARKCRDRARDEQIKPLQAYRREEMARSHECFFGPDRSYHEARRRLTRKLPACAAEPVATLAA